MVWCVLGLCLAACATDGCQNKLLVGRSLESRLWPFSLLVSVFQENSVYQVEALQVSSLGFGDYSGHNRGSKGCQQGLRDPFWT